MRGWGSGVGGRGAEITLRVNGAPHRVWTAPNRTLLDVLRDDLGLTGTKRGCDQGECGACTVHVDGRSVNACLVLAIDADGAEVTTIEGLARGGALHPLQRAFLEEGAVQCGYCTPGMIMQGAAVLAASPAPTRAQIREGIAGNLCRCTGYAKIVRAIERVSGFGVRGSGGDTGERPIRSPGSRAPDPGRRPRRESAPRAPTAPKTRRSP